MMNPNEINETSDEIVLGYCQLCRAKEREIYGSVGGWPLGGDSNSPDTSITDAHHHAVACDLAKCLHPCVYVVDHENKQMGGVTAHTVLGFSDSDSDSDSEP